jgi:hypothetical protein
VFFGAAVIVGVQFKHDPHGALLKALTVSFATTDFAFAGADSDNK